MPPRFFQRSTKFLGMLPGAVTQDVIQTLRMSNSDSQKLILRGGTFAAAAASSSDRVTVDRAVISASSRSPTRRSRS